MQGLQTPKSWNPVKLKMSSFRIHQKPFGLSGRKCWRRKPDTSMDLERNLEEDMMNQYRAHAHEHLGLCAEVVLEGKWMAKDMK